MLPYRREICDGKPVGNIDGPYHVTDIFEYIDKNVDNLIRSTGLDSGNNSPEGAVGLGGSTGNWGVTQETIISSHSRAHN